MITKEYTKIVSCFYCGKEKEIYKHRNKDRFFCDIHCYCLQRKLDPKTSKSTPFYNKREKHPSWRGGKRKASSGYMDLYMPEHHRARKNGYVYEHIVVLEKKLGRKIKREDGHVHHIDRNKTNNKPENLMLMSVAEHMSHHHTGAYRFPKNAKSYESYKPTKEEKINGIIVPKEKLPRGCYFLRILV